MKENSTTSTITLGQLMQAVWRRFSLHTRNHPFLVLVGGFLLVFFLLLVAFVSVNAQTIDATDRYLVHVSVNGQRQSVPTRARNVSELMERMDIEINDEDIVEPGLEAEINSNEFSINVYKARPVNVVEDGRKITIVTAEPTPEGVARKAGLEIYPEDLLERHAKVVEPLDIMREGLVAEEIIVDRATPVTINLYGQNLELRTHAQTVGELIEEKGIFINESDTLTPAADTAISDNLPIFITRVGTHIETVEEEIEPPVETVDDPSLLQGNTEVREEGQPGRKVVTYEIEQHNGEEVGRKVIQEVVVREPVKRVVARGSRVVISNPSANVRLGEQIAADMGWAHEFGCIYNIFQRESGWNHLAQNRSSGAYGIPQALPGNKMGPGWQTDPAVQIRWGIGYMVGRYGSPCGAQAFWNVNHWY